MICTLGDLLLDVVVTGSGALQRATDTYSDITAGPGGQAANVAAWARALGARSRLICARGADEASALAASHLQRLGVELCGPVLAGGGGVVVSFREPDGSRTMASDPGVAAQLTADDLDLGWVHGAAVLHVSGYCLLREPIAQAALSAAQAARRVTLDLASARDIELFGVARFCALVEEFEPELIFANEAERAAVPNLKAANWVIKRGARGASFPEGSRAAVAVDAVDSTGAGDALAAGYLVGGPDLAMATAGRCVGNVGAMPAP